jgi:hypothetical protein
MKVVPKEQRTRCEASTTKRENSTELRGSGCNDLGHYKDGDSRYTTAMEGIMPVFGAPAIVL